MHTNRNRSRTSDRDRQTPNSLKLIEALPKNTDRPNNRITANEHYLIIYISAVVHPSMAVESVGSDVSAVHDRVLPNDKIIELIYLHKRFSHKYCSSRSLSFVPRQTYVIQFFFRRSAIKIKFTDKCKKEQHQHEQQQQLLQHTLVKIN